MKLFRTSDLLIVFAVILVLLLTLPSANTQGSVVHVILDGRLIRTLDLAVDTSVEVGGVMTVKVENGAVRAFKADCPDQVCVKMGWISSPGIPIVCVPNRIMIIIPRQKDAEIDVITG